MKTLQLVEATSSGVGRHVMDLTKHLLRRGGDVHLVYSEVRSDAVFRDDLHQLGDSDSFKTRRLVMAHGVRSEDLLAARSLRRYVRSHGPFDLVHCHSTKAGLIGRVGLSGLSVRQIYTPNLFVSMGSVHGPAWRRLAGLVEFGLSKLCDRIIAVSQEEYDHAIELGIEAAKLRLIPNGVALNAIPAAPRTELRRRWGLAEDDVCVGFVGRLVPQKSPETMLRAFAELVHNRLASTRVSTLHAGPERVQKAEVRAPQREGSTRLVMIGDGPLAEPCRRLAAELGIETKVVWLGEQDAKTMMHAFDVLALTSDSEGHPLAVLEAMARGLPVVATRVGGVADTVRDGVNGFVVPVRDTSAIADALAKLIHDRALRERMGRASRVLAQEFSVDKMVDRTVAVYEELVRGTEVKKSGDMSVATAR